MAQNSLSNLFAAILSNYSASFGSTIIGNRSIAASLLANPAVQRISLRAKGDLAVFPFRNQQNISRISLRSYPYSQVSDPTDIFDPQQRDPTTNVLLDWTPIVVPSPIWASSPNTHAVSSAASSAISDPRQNLLVVTGYDLARIGVIDMSNSFTEIFSKKFPDDFNAQIAAKGKTPLPITGDWHGEGLYCQNVISAKNELLNTYLLSLFNYNPNGGYQNYDPSIVTKFEILYNPITQAYDLDFIDYVEVGLNSCSFEFFDNNLYSCAIGGMQKDGGYNPQTGIYYIDVDPTHTLSAKQIVVPSLASPLIPGDFRSIAFPSPQRVYIHTGYFTNSYANFVGNVYLTTPGNLVNPNPASWVNVKDISGSGNFRGLLAETSPQRLWFVNGSAGVEVYTSLPDNTSSPFTTYTMLQLSGNQPQYSQINSACLILPDGLPPQTKTSDGKTITHSISSHSPSRLAKEILALLGKTK